MAALNVRYVTVAALLGAGWFPVLLLQRMTREWLLDDPILNILCLVAASVIVALVFRRAIRRSERFTTDLVYAIVVPFVGCLVYLTLWNSVLLIHDLAAGRDINIHDMLSVYAMGITAVSMSLFITVPYGFACQYGMKAVSWVE